MNIKTTIVDVLKIQRQSLLEAEKFIGPAFVKAVNLLRAARGKSLLRASANPVYCPEMASTLRRRARRPFFFIPSKAFTATWASSSGRTFVFAIGKSGESEKSCSISFRPFTKSERK